MTADSLCQPPRELRVGDSANWQRNFTDYPASDGWALSYTIILPAAVHAFSATADGDAFAVALPAATTAAWSAGWGTLVECVTKGAERYTLGTCAIRILPDLAAASAGMDLRSPAKRMLDNIELWMQTGDPAIGAIWYGERRIEQYPPGDLLKIRSRLQDEVANEVGGNKGLVRRMLVQL